MSTKTTPIFSWTRDNDNLTLLTGDYPHACLVRLPGQQWKYITAGFLGDLKDGALFHSLKEGFEFVNLLLSCHGLTVSSVLPRRKKGRKPTPIEMLAFLLDCSTDEIGQAGKFYFRYWNEGEPESRSYTRAEIEAAYEDKT